MSEVLARVTTRTLDVPRGPDVVHRIRVPNTWFDRGETIEFELPRNLSCAACSGGGCDLCERSGAITLRGRDEPPEILTVTLPQRIAESDGRTVLLRIPEQGGLPPAEGEVLPRGLLLLRVEPAAVADAGVTRVEQLETRGSVSQRVADSLRVLKPKSTRGWLLAAAALVLLIAWALLAFRRHSWLG